MRRDASTPRCRVLLVASQYALLTAAAEGACALLRPLCWQHVYIPVLPAPLLEYVEAPTPYLMGLHCCGLPEPAALDGITVVDLDRNQVRV